MKRGVLLFWFQSMLAVLLLTANWACSRRPCLAKLESKQGEVQRNAANRGNTWNIATIGAAFSMGDALGTAHASNALLGLEGGGKLSVRQDTVVRFQNRRPTTKSQDFDIETGQALLQAGSNGLLFATSIGLAHLEANSQVLIRRTSDGLDLTLPLAKPVLSPAMKRLRSTKDNHT